MNFSSTCCQFSIIIEPLFESYNGMVSTASVEDLCRSTLSWLDQHCSLPALRPSESITAAKPISIQFLSICVPLCSHISCNPYLSLFPQQCWVHSASWVPPRPSWLTPASYQSRPHLLLPRATPLLPWTTPYSPLCSNIHPMWPLEEQTQWEKPSPSTGDLRVRRMGW